MANAAFGLIFPFNYYKQEVGVDPEPVKLGNFPDTQRTFENLAIGTTLTSPSTASTTPAKAPRVRGIRW